MKKLIAIFFIVVMCGQLLPSLPLFEKDQHITLISLTEEEHPDHSKIGKALKKESKDFFIPSQLLPAPVAGRLFAPAMAVSLLSPPTLCKPTPPPDTTC